ncbi:MAG TPA: c-type cytochrome [Candidatus Binatia bacterium]|nr:c-type cytochrome [Candidatus Binatia bacterium]
MLPGHGFPRSSVIPAILLVSLLCLSQVKQNPSSAQPKAAVPGRSTFNSVCAACHGLDGRGSDKAVDITTSATVRDLSDAQLASVISNGVPGTGMPAFRTLSAAQVRGLVGYLRSLQGKGEAGTLPGDAKRGAGIFFGKGGCSSCHAVAGKGGFLAPDLTGYAATASAEGVRDEILRSPRVPAQGYRAAIVTTTQGEHIEGLIRNEDNFSIQLQTADGSFHFLRKSDVQSCERREGSLMPTDYREKLSDAELDDLVNYLMNTPNPNTIPTKHKDDWE